MASSHEVVVTLGYDSRVIPEALHTYLTSPAEEALTGQHLMEVCGDRTHPHGLTGSHQAGAVRIYAGIIRRSSNSEIKEWLGRAPWGYEAPVAVLYSEDDEDGPTVFMLREQK